MQLTYSTTPARGIEGGLYDVNDNHIVTRVCENTSIPFGRMVIRGTTPETQAKLPAATGFVPLGITVATQKEQNSDGTVTYNQYEAMNIATEGSVWVVTENAVTAGADVWVRHTAGAGALTVGRFTDSSVTSAAANKIIGAVYDTTSTSDKLTLVRFNLPQ